MQNDHPLTGSTAQNRGLRIRLAILLGLVTSVAVFTGWQWSQAPSHLEKAEIAFQKGDRKAEIQALFQHLKTHPESTSVRLRLAALLRDSSPEDALALLQNVPSSDLKRSDVLQQTAILCLLLNRSEDAKIALRELSIQQPENMGAHLSLAELYFQQNDAESALPHATRAAELDPSRPETFLLLAEIHDELKSPARMIEPLRTAIALQPNLYSAHLNLAYAFHKIGQMDDAAIQAQWCLEANPTDVAAMFILASVARDQGRFQEAQEQLKAAFQVSPNDLDCRILEADLLLYSRKPQAAYQRLQELYETQQSTVRYLGALARAAASSGQQDKARQLYQQVQALVEVAPSAVQSATPE